MQGIVAFFQMMVIVRIELHLKLFVGIDEGIDILHRMLHMDVVITRAMNDEHIAG